jgi:NADH dehydrogenase FAD-containing subunit
MVANLPPFPTSQDAIAARAEIAASARNTANNNGSPSLVDHAVGEGRRLRVVVIGAGFSGLGAAIYLPQHVDNMEIQVYDRAAEVGGVCE